MQVDLLTAIQDLTIAMREYTASIEGHKTAMKELLAFEEAKRNQSDWMTAEEVAQKLQLPMNGTSQYYKRRINRAVDKYAVRFNGKKNRVYYRGDINELSRKYLEGKVKI